MGRDFSPEFSPDLTPVQMLTLGVFSGAYIVDWHEFPPEWEQACRTENYFGVTAGQPYEVWKQKGWIHPDDPRGWFQWYCRYYLGRRMPGEDERQIKRWKAMRRHMAQVQKHCAVGDATCRPRQRQALLQWGYDMRVV
jgi:hypothetical protein